ncbi:hypothetical protein HDE_04181 [Halotydeus destructor]|nr:hypothetical protein HDE_04181 [Halotydeus destructor]
MARKHIHLEATPKRSSRRLHKHDLPRPSTPSPSLTPNKPTQSPSTTQRPSASCPNPVAEDEVPGEEEEDLDTLLFCTQDHYTTVTNYFQKKKNRLTSPANSHRKTKHARIGWGDMFGEDRFVIPNSRAEEALPIVRQEEPQIRLPEFVMPNLELIPDPVPLAVPEFDLETNSTDCNVFNSTRHPESNGIPLVVPDSDLISRIEFDGWSQETVQAPVNVEVQPDVAQAEENCIANPVTEGDEEDLFEDDDEAWLSKLTVPHPPSSSNVATIIPVAHSTVLPQTVPKNTNRVELRVEFRPPSPISAEITARANDSINSVVVAMSKAKVVSQEPITEALDVDEFEDDGDWLSQIQVTSPVESLLRREAFQPEELRRGDEFSDDFDDDGVDYSQLPAPRPSLSQTTEPRISEKDKVNLVRISEDEWDDNDDDLDDHLEPIDMGSSECDRFPQNMSDGNLTTGAVLQLLNESRDEDNLWLDSDDDCLAVMQLPQKTVLSRV